MILSSSPRPDTTFTTGHTIQELLFSAKNQLSVVTDSPLLEAEILLAQVLKKPRSYLHAWFNQGLNSLQINTFSNYVSRRFNQEPIAYIIGMREFWSLTLEVSIDTLIPRPETELLIEIALDLFAKDNEVVEIADLGTGCGAISLALAHEKPHWKICATDISEKALQVANRNAKNLKIENIHFYQGHWCAALPSQNFDLIVSNPPYLSETEWDKYSPGLVFEPRTALVSGLNGLDAIQTIVNSAKSYLKPHGYLLIEHGFLQGAAVRKIFSAAEYGQIRSVRDLSGQERATLGKIF